MAYAAMRGTKLGTVLAMRGTKLGTVLCNVRYCLAYCAIHWAVLSYCMELCGVRPGHLPILLCACYAMSGTDLAYGATTDIPPYAYDILYPVLTERMSLQLTHPAPRFTMSSAELAYGTMR
eukprot:3941941-Rhodomonas_salina.2